MIRIGDKIDGRYHITSRIAHGGMADIYEAIDLVSRKTVALKIMREDMLDNKDNVSRFSKECFAAASLNNPHIVKVYDNGEIDGRPYMVNEYVKGQTLRDKLNFTSIHRLSPREACEVMEQLTSGIQYVHEHGIVHRDIKPDNLFYLPDGSIKIADFGISSSTDEKETGDAIAGTVYYTAPEILMGGQATPQSDIYSMGIVFFEILTGRVPFEGKSAQDVAVAHIKSHFPEPSRIQPGIPKALDRIIITACRKRQNERYKSAKEMHDDIVAALSNNEDFKEKKSFLARIFGFK